MPYKFFKISSALSKTKRKAEFLRNDRALPGIVNNDQVTQQGQMSEYSQHNRRGSATPQIAANDPATTRVVPLHRQPMPAPTRGRFSSRTGSSSVSSSGSPVNARSHNRSSMPNGDSNRHEGGGALHASTDRGTLDGEGPPQPLDTSPTFPPTPDSLATSPVLGRSPRDEELGGESFMPIYSTEARVSGIQRSTSSLHRRMSEGRSVRADSGELSGVEDDCDRWSTSSSVQFPPTPSEHCDDGRIYKRPGPSSAQHALPAGVHSPVSPTL
ncbi:hypothetical protein WOLCODRAFT_150100 [Wolfiporia cocos MD-104 SS10]|uniref:Uncharacterized protein n=1 Tax=Wolfiporia cocos (strain MD-104) TaxID=742152 RepID=A0A2H3JTM3_WOLCO|nr:hypothetical protein WOLCODRAFT_150100 [Wolfiporia cocos MD-104 SS10]